MSISLAFLAEEIDLMSSTAGVEQKSPHLMPGVEKEDFQEAINKSQARANWNPAAAAIPLTTHKVGTDEFLILSMSSVQELKTYLGSFESANYFRSCPEQKTVPYPYKTIIFIN